MELRNILIGRGICRGIWRDEKNFPKRDDKFGQRQLLPRPSSHFTLVVDGEHRAQAERTGLDGVRCPFLALFNWVSPVRDTNTRWPSTDSIVLPPAQLTVPSTIRE